MPVCNTTSTGKGVNKSKPALVASTSSVTKVPTPLLLFDMFEIKNIKLSIKIGPFNLNTVCNHLKYHNIEMDIKNNFIIIRNKFVYILFKSNSKIFNHINITKIQSEIFINESITHILNILKPLNIIYHSYKIDNITAILHNNNMNVNILKLANNLKSKFYIRLNKEKFPGIFIAFRNGLVIIFNSGKIVSVGCKSINSLKELHAEVILHINNGVQTLKETYYV